MRLLLLLHFLCCFLGIKAQTNFLPGYIITLEDDTLHGLIDYRGDIRNARRCDFRENEQSPVKEYLPGSIKSYRYDDSKYYVSRSVPVKGSNEPVFLEFLVNGISDLFYYTDGKNNHFYVGKKDGQFYELTNELQEVRINDRNYRKNSKKYIGTLRVAFADCKELYPMIDHARLEHKSLINLSRKYHDYVCEGEQCVIYEKKVRAIHVSLGAALLANSSVFTYTPIYDHWTISFDPAVYPTFQLLMNTTMPRVSEKLSLELAVEAGKASFEGTMTENWPLSTTTSTQDLLFETTLLKGNAGIKYTYPTGKIRPVVLIGAHYSRLKNKEIFYLAETIDRMAGLSANVGIDLAAKAFTPFIRLGYESSIGSARYTWQTNSKLKTVRLQAGMYF